MPNDIKTKVLRNLDLGGGNYLCEFLAPEFDGMLPAQFVMLGIPGAETLLRRPYSVCGLPGTFADSDPRAYSVLYKTVGKGTGLLSTLRPESPLSLLGPLGNGFTPPQAGVRPVYVAGGIGSAPFPAMFKEFGDLKPLMVYGARSRNELPLGDWFAERCEEMRFATDDGSRGHRGRLTGPLEELLNAHRGEPMRLYVCGPDPMLHAVAKLAHSHGVACELAMEAHMACGFGVCLGCVVPVHRPDGGIDYARLCVEGPVMDAEAIAW